MKLKTPTRANFSRYGKLCDQTFYHDSQPVQHPIEDPPPAKPKGKVSTSGFTSISREKKGNMHYYVKLPFGQFSYHPNHNVGKNRSASYSVSKAQKYKKEKLVQFQLCPRNPLIKDNPEMQMRASCSSLRDSKKADVKLFKTTMHLSLKDKEKEGSMSMRDTRHTKNYSIISPRQTSAVGFFADSKIKEPRYLSKQDLNQVQGELDEKHYQNHLKPNSNGTTLFKNRRGRFPNRCSKGFQAILYPYEHQKHYNNYSETQFPTGPVGHVHMEQHLDRTSFFPQRLGPNVNPFPIDYTRINQSAVDLNLKTYRDEIKTRYDRVGPEPNTRLDYDAKAQALSGLLEMNRMQGRNPELFPIVDPAIKKAGDKEMKEELKRHIPVKEINEAHRHKNVVNYTKMVQEGQ